MGKRKQEHKKGNRTKKFKISGFIDPNTSGVYATCNRGKERACINELTNLLNEKAGEYFDLELIKNDTDKKSETETETGNEDGKEQTQSQNGNLEAAKEDKRELTIEEQIRQEVEEIKDAKNPKTSLLSAIELDCECLVFIKTKKPIEPEILVKKLVEESMETKQKTTRYTQKLTPITYSVSPSLEEIKKLAKRVLSPHFHQPENQKPYKFAIQVTRRNFNTIEKTSIIKTVAECVGRDHGHSVDLKNYDKLILIECYKTNVGMSVVEDYEKYYKFNLQQLYEKTT